MKTVRMKIDLASFNQEKLGLIDTARVDATTEEEVQAQIAAEDHEAMLEAGMCVRAIRSRLGLSQVELSLRIGVSIKTIRDWEQGRRMPTGAAKALFKILDRAPEASLMALH
jgi:putative transcriptional regulator